MTAAWPDMVGRLLSQGLLALSLATPALHAADDSVPPARVPDPAPGRLSVMAMWQQILPDAGERPGGLPRTELRFIVHAPGLTPGAACRAPELSFVGLARGSLPSFRTTLKGRSHDRGSTYSGSICTAPLDPTADEVAIMQGNTYAPLYHDPRYYDGRRPPQARMPGPARFGYRLKEGHGLRGVFLSDTGCRGKQADNQQTDAPASSNRFWQDCTRITPQGTAAATVRSWPLNAHAWDAAAQNPDFVIHGGDYHYYYEVAPYWQSKAGQDRLEYWFQEFLLPAQPLLLAAPVAFGRGNHERCEAGWFGSDWLALFHVGEQTSCGATGDSNNGSSVKSWRFTVAPRKGDFHPYTIWMIDSADPRLAAREERYREPSGTGRNKLWVTHYPLLEIEYYASGGKLQLGDPQNRQAINQSITQACDGDASCWPNIMLAGHQHLFQHLRLRAREGNSSMRSELFIGGHSGARLSENALPAFADNEVGLRSCEADLSFDSSALPPAEVARRQILGRDDMLAQVTTASAYGYLLLTRDVSSAGPEGPESGWRITPRWYGGEPPVEETAGSCDQMPLQDQQSKP